MTAEDGASSPGAIERVLHKVIEGGLPQIIAGPAGKAISRLIGGAADIPAAWLEQRAQAIRDETIARSTAFKELGKSVATAASADADIVDRATARLLGTAYKEQINRESIAAKAISDLSESPPSVDAGEPDDDWLNLFEVHAERATSERLRDTWARILTGQIRKPGSFSLATLNFVSILDTNIALVTEEFMSLSFGGAAIFAGGQYSEGDHLLGAATLAGFGLISEGKHMKIRINDIGIAALDFTEYALVLKGAPEFDVGIPVYLLTNVGREVCQIARRTPNPQSLKQVAVALKSTIPQLTSLGIARIVSRSGNSFSWSNESYIDV